MTGLRLDDDVARADVNLDVLRLDSGEGRRDREGAVFLEHAYGRPADHLALSGEPVRPFVAARAAAPEEQVIRALGDTLVYFLLLVSVRALPVHPYAGHNASTVFRCQ